MNQPAIQELQLLLDFMSDDDEEDDRGKKTSLNEWLL